MARRPHKKPATNTNSLGQVRIISGLWRGRKLPVHDAQGLRPTTDRVKETLFNWIAQEIPQSRCLDIFAGSGGLGFEAASRQATQVTMLEMNRQVYQQLTRNVAALNAECIDVHHTDSLSYLDKPGQAYDIVFIDPPFRQGLIDEVITRLENHHWLTPNALIYIETEKELVLPPMPKHWQLLKEKQAGQVSYRLFERSES
ncbi:16S rRNA (guanine(966)-N(2))-methyltransferase RsmD [Vibrio zhugei]|uniref:Ribosomal RNA small subunit methyltransferase D n=1 Tax=Vibrio zhugei TaxID=2479546 RepID=A0ABV7CCR3_9VIBR|nr:16S rRNA (guanine(966)-N(2))-methyltransferase RsmD [Vibrio zhugei]